MADQFTLSGSYNATPLGGAASLDPSIDATISEQMALQAKFVANLDLTVDTPVAVPFGTVGNAHVVVLKATGKVSARLTSADGSTQVVPFDTVLIVMCQSVPFTAIDLTRVAATATVVRVFLGEKA